MVQAMKNLKGDEMDVSSFIVDGDSSSRKSIKVLSDLYLIPIFWISILTKKREFFVFKNNYSFDIFQKCKKRTRNLYSWFGTMIYICKAVFPSATAKQCVKHVDRNMRKAIARLQSIRSLNANERAALKKSHGHLGIDWVGCIKCELNRAVTTYRDILAAVMAFEQYVALQHFVISNLG